MQILRKSAKYFAGCFQSHLIDLGVVKLGDGAVRNKTLRLFRMTYNFDATYTRVY